MLLKVLSIKKKDRKRYDLCVYIGPKPDTCEDFWRMIWELKLKSIVMLTNIIEGALRLVNSQIFSINIFIFSFFFFKSQNVINIGLN